MHPNCVGEEHTRHEICEDTKNHKSVRTFGVCKICGGVKSYSHEAYKVIECYNPPVVGTHTPFTERKYGRLRQAI